MYLQKLEIQALQQKFDGLRRNLEALNNANLNERNQNDKLQNRIAEVERDKEKLTMTIKELNTKLTTASLNPDYESKKEMEISELKVQIEARKDELYHMKKDVILKQKRIQELEIRQEMLIKDKERDTEVMRSDLKATQDLVQV